MTEIVGGLCAKLTARQLSLGVAIASTLILWIDTSLDSSTLWLQDQLAEKLTALCIQSPNARVLVIAECEPPLQFQQRVQTLLGTAVEMLQPDAIKIWRPPRVRSGLLVGEQHVAQVSVGARKARLATSMRSW